MTGAVALAAGVLLAAPLTQTQRDPSWPAGALTASEAAASDRRGEVTACGQVMGMRAGPETPVPSLIIGLDRAATPALSARVAPASLKSFPPFLREQLQHRVVCLRGRIERGDGPPRIDVKSWKQFVWFGKPPSVVPGFAAGAFDARSSLADDPFADAGITPPTVIRRVQPNYAQGALGSGLQGEVHVLCVVRADGTVGDVQLVESLDPKTGLDVEAILAVKQWQFSPATRDDVPVPVVVKVILTFSLGWQFSVAPALRPIG